MYIFPEDIRRELEALPVPMAYYQQDGNDVIPLLVTEGLCQLMHLHREDRGYGSAGQME